MPLILRKTVVLVGMMGAGKTAVGTALARHLGVPFLDSDVEIESAAGRSIPEIFERDGEVFFRDREAQVITRLLSGPPAILSAGGGAYLDPGTRARIRALALAVWLDATLEILWQRVRHRTTRPLLRTPDPRGTLARLLAERAPAYAEADLRVPAEAGLSVDGMARRVAAALATRPDVLKTAP